MQIIARFNCDHQCSRRLWWHNGQNLIALCYETMQDFPFTSLAILTKIFVKLDAKGDNHIEVKQLKVLISISRINNVFVFRQKHQSRCCISICFSFHQKKSLLSWLGKQFLPLPRLRLCAFLSLATLFLSLLRLSRQSSHPLNFDQLIHGEHSRKGTLHTFWLFSFHIENHTAVGRLSVLLECRTATWN